MCALRLREAVEKGQRIDCYRTSTQHSISSAIFFRFFNMIISFDSALFAIIRCLFLVLVSRIIPLFCIHQYNGTSEFFMGALIVDKNMAIYRYRIKRHTQTHFAPSVAATFTRRQLYRQTFSQQIKVPIDDLDKPEIEFGSNVAHQIENKSNRLVRSVHDDFRLFGMRCCANWLHRFSRNNRRQIAMVRDDSCACHLLAFAWGEFIVYSLPSNLCFMVQNHCDIRSLPNSTHRHTFFCSPSLVVVTFKIYDCSWRRVGDKGMADFQALKINWQFVFDGSSTS